VRFEQDQYLYYTEEDLLKGKGGGGGSTIGRPPVGDIYAFYFPSAALPKKQATDIENGLRRLAGSRSEFHVCQWDKAGPERDEVLQRFRIRDLPALVVIKPFRGLDIGQHWDWADTPEMWSKLKQPGGMPVHIVFQGDQHFRDIGHLADDLEQMSLLFKYSETTVNAALRSRRIRALLRKAGVATTVLTRIKLTYSSTDGSVSIGIS
jgi:hypothetical protein